jgi:hypothetical protein
MYLPDILDLQQHRNPKGNPYTVAIVDDPNDGKTKLVVMFEGAGDIAIIPLDKLIEEENISEDANDKADEMETFLRDALAEG